MIEFDGEHVSVGRYLEMGSFTTIQRHIRKLESLGIVREVTDKGRNRIYRADEILRILDDHA